MLLQKDGYTTLYFHFKHVLKHSIIAIFSLSFRCDFRTRKSAFRKSFNVPMKLNDEEMTPVTKRKYTGLPTNLDLHTLQ